jgi:hypothetical protein
VTAAHPPRMSEDHAAFLPRVLEHPSFGRDGLLFGSDRLSLGRLHWVVVDPRRHAMFVWRKTVPSFPAAARTLGASVFTSGPFTNHAGGSPVKATVKLGLDVVRAVGAPRTLPAETRAALTRHYQARVPLGYVIGEHEGIHETTVDRPRVHYFGRRAGVEFGDYEIGRGNPKGMTEAIGGLFRPLTDYQPYSGDRVIRTGYWGLAPLVDSPVVRGPAASAAIDDGCEGLVVFTAGRANTRRLAALLAGVGVKDAVQVDGGDSLLLGRATDVIVGGLMPEWKRMLQVWGVQFQRKM